MPWTGWCRIRRGGQIVTSGTLRRGWQQDKQQEHRRQRQMLLPHTPLAPQLGQHRLLVQTLMQMLMQMLRERSMMTGLMNPVVCLGQQQKERIFLLSLMLPLLLLLLVVLVMLPACLLAAHLGAAAGAALPLRMKRKMAASSSNSPTWQQQYRVLLLVVLPRPRLRLSSKVLPRRQQLGALTGMARAAAASRAGRVVGTRVMLPSLPLRSLSAASNQAAVMMARTAAGLPARVLMLTSVSVGPVMTRKTGCWSHQSV